VTTALPKLLDTVNTTAQISTPYELAIVCAEYHIRHGRVHIPIGFQDSLPCPEWHGTLLQILANLGTSLRHMREEAKV
jgi:hypothetical protein